MKKPSSKIRSEIAKLQEQLRQAETREAERIGRVALKAGLGEIEIEETELQDALAELAERFRQSPRDLQGGSGIGRRRATDFPDQSETPLVAAGAAQIRDSEA